MPHKSEKPCAHRGCPKLTAKRYCEAHAKEHAGNYNKYQRNPDSNKRYGRRWRGVRGGFLTSNPLCEICRENGRLTPATIAHHKVAVRDGGTDSWDNLQALCHECHARLHAGAGDYF